MAHSWVVKGLMLILVVSFGIWGVGDIFRGNPLQRKVAKVGDEAITVQELNHAFEKKLTEFRQKSGMDLTMQQAKQLGLQDLVLDELVDRAELDQAMPHLGLEASDKTVFNWLAAQPNMRNKDGSLNKEGLQTVLDKLHMDEAQLIAQERKALAGREFARALEAGGKTPETIAGPLTAARGQKRILDVVTVMNNGIGGIADPDDKTLQEFYQQHQQAFTAPEYRALTIARLSTNEVAKDIALTDDQLKKEYDARSAQFAHPERRDVLQVVVQNEEKAKQLAASARASGNLANAADGMGYKTVPLNGTEEKTLLPELAKPLFALKPGQVSDPVKSSLGWHVLQLKKIIPAGTPAFDEVKDQLRETMQRDRAIDAATRMVNQMDDELAAGHALEDIADALKLRLIKIPAVDAEGKTPDGKEPPELPGKADVLRAAFGQNANEVSPIMDDKNGNYVVVRTDEVTASAVRPFEKVKDQVLAAWKAQEQAKRAAVEAESIARDLRAGKAPSSFAAQPGVEVRVSKPISLAGDKDAALPENALPQIMKMKKDDVTTSALPDRQLVLRLADIVDIDAAAAKAERAKLGDEIDRQLSDELSDEYLRYLKTIYPVTIDRDVLDTLQQQGQQGR
jgi:peptidyl-prolyl cis-trans isomerase D